MIAREMIVQLAVLAAIVAATAAHAVEPKEMLKDPALEARARQVGAQLACVVCQGESIEDSGAEIAADMRTLVRQRVLAGDTNGQIMDYMVSRYGDYVLRSPRFTPRTYLLWFGPLVVLLLGAVVVFRRLRRREPEAVPLTPEEQAALAAMNAGEKRA
jgi:cytochrome c-type biogenesis protein CcmH